MAENLRGIFLTYTVPFGHLYLRLPVSLAVLVLLLTSFFSCKETVDQRNL